MHVLQRVNFKKKWAWIYKILQNVYGSLYTQKGLWESTGKTTCLCTWHIRARLAHQAVSIQICLSLASEEVWVLGNLTIIRSCTKKRSPVLLHAYYHSRRSNKAGSIRAQFPSQNLLSRLLSTSMLHPASWRSSSFASFGPGWFCGHKVNTSNTLGWTLTKQISPT